MGMAAPQDGEQLTKTELSTAQATAAAELALGALKIGMGMNCMGP